jgi:four helix bundle protein
MFLILKVGMNMALEKSRQFARWAYNLFKHLCDKKHEYVFSKQLLGSGAPIGANLCGNQYSVSHKEPLAKATISSKECAETEYWLGPPNDTNLINSAEYISIINDCKEILHRLTSTRKMMEQLASRK